jgi:Chlorophyll A-B binding protein
MMKVIVAALLASTAAAFQSAAPKSASSTALKYSYENELGVITPTGFFDPFQLSKTAKPEVFAKYREAELKHGRVAMLAVVGYVVPEFYRFPGDIDWHGTAFADIPNGIDALFSAPAVGLAQIFGVVGLVDVEGLWKFKIGEPDLSPAILEKRQLQELQNGRLAMLAFAELIRHDLTTDGEPLITGLPFLYSS